MRVIEVVCIEHVKVDEWEGTGKGPSAMDKIPSRRMKASQGDREILNWNPVMGC